MGVSYSPAQFAAKMRAASSAVEDSARAGVQRSALMVKDETLRELRSAVGADLRMSGVGRRGAKVGVRFDIKGTKNPTALVRATGPVHLVESGTKPHPIPTARRRGRGRLPVIPGVGPRAHVNHPGTHGKHPWAKGVARAIPKATRSFGAGVSTSLGRIF